jgi:hypothetical protein
MYPLVPFVKEDGSPFTAVDVRDTQVFGYTYKGLLNWTDTAEAREDLLRLLKNLYD